MSGRTAKGKGAARQRGSVIANISWFGFITFEWITIILNKLRREDNFSLPKIEEDAAIEYYTYKLGRHLKGFKKRKRPNGSGTQNNPSERPHGSTVQGTSNEESHYYCPYQKRGITLALLRTFRKQLSCITLFYVIHTLFLIFVALCIENYILLLKGQGKVWLPFAHKYKELAFGFILVGVICVDVFFDAVLTFFDYRLRLNMEITLMYFLYKINLEDFRGKLCSFPYPEGGAGAQDAVPMLTGGGAREGGDHHDVQVEGAASAGGALSCPPFACQPAACDPMGCVGEKQDVPSGEAASSVAAVRGGAAPAEEAKPKGEIVQREESSTALPDDPPGEWAEGDKEESDSCDINIYNIMFVDTPFLIHFISSMIDLCNMLIKFTISFYMFYFKMGREAVVNGILLIIFLYSLMFAFELASSLFKIKHLKCRDARISNMHHILKEYKLMKMFNWEAIAFDYVNRHRKKEMKFCTVRIYLGSLSNYINNISMNVVEVAIFFFFIKGELNSNKPINVSSIITPLFVYKSLIAGMSNFPNIINNLLEGTINIGRINKYIRHYMFRSEGSEAGGGDRGGKRNNQHGEDPHWGALIKSIFFGKGYGKAGKARKAGKAAKSGGSNRTHYGAARGGLAAGTAVEVAAGKEAAPPPGEVILKLSGCYFSAEKPPSGGHDATGDATHQPNGQPNGQPLVPAALLKNVNLTLRNNTLVVILGNVGSGKTLFFNSLLGQLRLSRGSCYVKSFANDTPVMYVPQFYWVTIGTIRSMILFGNRFDPFLYYRAIVQSELVNDMNTFKRKDLRYVNDEHSLSKGQKARICLARALYHHYIHMSDLLVDYERDVRVNKKWRERGPSEGLFKTASSLSRGRSGGSNGSRSHPKEEKRKKLFVKGGDADQGGKKGTDDEPSSQEEKYELHDVDNSTNYTFNTANMTNTCSHVSRVKNARGEEEEDDEELHPTQQQRRGGSNNDVIIGPSGEMYTQNCDLFKNNSLLKECLEQGRMSYLYLLDDLFCALDPCISKNIFYNLFCSRENVEGFKGNCGFVLTANQNIWHSFLEEDIVRDLQYDVQIYRLQNRSLVTSQMLEFFSEQQGGGKNALKNDLKYQKFVMLKELKSTYSCRLEPLDSASAQGFGRKYTTVTQNYVEKRDEHVMNNTIGSVSISSLGSTRKTTISNYAEVLVKEKKSRTRGNSCSLSFEQDDKITLHEFEKVSKVLQAQLKDNYMYEYLGNQENGDEGEEEELRFKGNIKWETFVWYLRMIGNSLIAVILLFMIVSIFTDEIKNMLLFMASTLIKSEEEQNDSEILKKQLVYLKYFVLLPCVSLVTSLIAFMLIAHGIAISAVKVHTEVLQSILHAPIHAFYSNNLGNIINRFITDINVLDNGIIKRIYKTFYTFFRFLFTIFLLNYMVYQTVYVFPMIIFLIYVCVFQKYSRGCKEAQRGYLSSHAPLCTIYSNTIMGKDIINLYKKNQHFLDLYAKRVFDFKNYTIFKWCLTIWASLYVQLIVLCLTGFYIIYPYVLHPYLGNKQDPNFMNKEKNASTIGYCITFSCSLGFIIKALLYDYTHVEKEMCSTQRLEECSQMINEQVGYADEGGEAAKCGKGGPPPWEEVSREVPKEVPLTSPSKDVPCGKAKYGLHFENVFVSYKKKIFIDKSRNLYYYANEKSCLRNMNIYALKGQKIGIVGKSGAGKSTTILSVLGLIPTTRGTISIEGRDIKTMSLQEKKRIIGLLPQSSFVFFHWNIRTYIDPYGSFSDDDIMEAFKLIGINLRKEDLYKYIYKQKKKSASRDDRAGGGLPNGADKGQKGNSSSSAANFLAVSDDCIRYLALKKKSASRDDRAGGGLPNAANFLAVSDDCIRYLALVRIFLNRHTYKLVLIDEIPVLNLNLSNSNANNFFSSDVKSFEYIIRNYFAHITVLIIAHDASTLSCCDFIYVVAKGEVSYKCSYADIQTQAALAALIQQQTE
ncbi:hypothetical protein PVIIG_03934 [Plasmodium vivax India VII]|uniref:Multidrug resistance associated protein n=1 Tax=Plasmodium vivax India VII TaxID=1077284 RepID=A0A0J9S6J8_PLAVI|nr:hypothetical protein PVIIG_03934 [Plasmodium vivax India VII]